MLTKEKAHQLAEHWIRAWNSHDLDAIMSHYGDEVVLESPAAARLLGDSAGTVKGKPALRAYFQRGLEFYPQLRFELIDVLWGLSSLVLYYINQQATKAAEFMEVDANGKVKGVVANYTD